MQISSKKKHRKIAQKINFGRVLGSIWEGVGTVLGLFWELLGAFGPFFGRLKSSFYKALVPDGLQEASWIDFGSIWVDLDRFSVDFSWILDGFWKDFWKIFQRLFVLSSNIAILWKITISLGKTIIFEISSFIMSGPPRCLAKPRGASQCAGVLTLRMLNDTHIIPL